MSSVFVVTFGIDIFSSPVFWILKSGNYGPRAPSNRWRIGTRHSAATAVFRSYVSPPGKVLSAVLSMNDSESFSTSELRSLHHCYVSTARSQCSAKAFENVESSKRKRCIPRAIPKPGHSGHPKFMHFRFSLRRKLAPFPRPFGIE